MRTLIVLLLVFMAGTSMACEFGKTYMDFYGKATEIEKKWSEDSGLACYVDPAHPVFSKAPPICYFEDGIIEIFTGRKWSGTQQALEYHKTKKIPQADYSKCSYVLYKGHRWYPQYHGIIYVYEDGREVK